MPKIIQVTDGATNNPNSPSTKIYIFVDGMFSMYRLPGQDLTVIKGTHGFEKVVETPEQILVLIRAASPIDWGRPGVERNV